MERTIKVINQPATFILSNSELSDEVIRAQWLAKYNKGNKHVPEASKSLESCLIRSTKKMNRINK